MDSASLAMANTSHDEDGRNPSCLTDLTHLPLRIFIVSVAGMHFFQSVIICVVSICERYVVYLHRPNCIYFHSD